MTTSDDDDDDDDKEEEDENFFWGVRCGVMVSVLDSQPREPGFELYGCVSFHAVISVHLAENGPVV